MRYRLKVGLLSPVVFAVLTAAFVVGMKACARAIWPSHFSTVAGVSLRARTLVVWEDTRHAATR